eukprot:SAG31_NODE_1569_length_7855_cov_13.073234_5_plen_185_part_00
MPGDVKSARRRMRLLKFLVGVMIAIILSLILVLVFLVLTADPPAVMTASPQFDPRMHLTSPQFHPLPRLQQSSLLVPPLCQLPASTWRTVTLPKTGMLKETMQSESLRGRTPRKYCRLEFRASLYTPPPRPCLVSIAPATPSTSSTATSRCVDATHTRQYGFLCLASHLGVAGCGNSAVTPANR